MGDVPCRLDVALGARAAPQHRVVGECEQPLAEIARRDAGADGAGATQALRGSPGNRLGMSMSPQDGSIIRPTALIESPV